MKHNLQRLGVSHEGGRTTSSFLPVSSAELREHVDLSQEMKESLNDMKCVI